MRLAGQLTIGWSHMLVTDGVELDDREIEIDFARAGGPGGQKVNKTSSAVVLRFHAATSGSLPPEVRERLLTIAGSRLDGGGDIVIHARRYRSQSRNREDALDRLRELILRAMERPLPRRATRPGRAAVARRLDAKRRRSDLKRSRCRTPPHTGDDL